MSFIKNNQGIVGMNMNDEFTSEYPSQAGKVVRINNKGKIIRINNKGEAVRINNKGEVVPDTGGLRRLTPDEKSSILAKAVTKLEVHGDGTTSNTGTFSNGGVDYFQTDSTTGTQIGFPATDSATSILRSDLYNEDKKIVAHGDFYCGKDLVVKGNLIVEGELTIKGDSEDTRKSSPGEPVEIDAEFEVKEWDPKWGLGSLPKRTKLPNAERVYTRKELEELFKRFKELEAVTASKVTTEGIIF